MTQRNGGRSADMGTTSWSRGLDYFWGKLPKDKMLFVHMLILILASILLVFSSTAKMAYSTASSSTVAGHLTNQITYICISLGAFVAAYAIPIFVYRYLAPLVFAGSLGLTLAAILFGSSINGAARWIQIGPFSFQPSEALKVATMVLLAWSMSKIAANSRAEKARVERAGGGRKELSAVQDLTTLKLSPDISFSQPYVDFDGMKSGFFHIVLPIVAACGIVITAHTSAALIIGLSSLFVLVYGGIRIKEILALILYAGVAFVLYVVAGFGRASTVVGRLLTWTDGAETGGAAAIAVEQLADTERAMIAIHNGGWTGLGAGQSLMRAEMIHPESDYAFAFLTEEMGLLISLFLVLNYIWIFFRAYLIFQDSENQFASYMVLGLGSLIVVQALMHVAVSLGIMPEMGLTLPIISRGGTALIFCCASIGIMMRASYENDVEKAKADDELED